MPALWEDTCNYFIYEGTGYLLYVLLINLVRYRMHLI